MSIASLKIQSDLISLESRTDDVLQPSTLRRLPSFISDVRTYLADLLAISRTPGNVIDDRKAQSTLRKINYITLSPVDVYVPVGLNVRYLDYVTVLERVMPLVQSTLNQTLRPTAAWLAELATNPDRLTALRPKDFPITTDAVDVARRELAACFEKGGVKDKRGFGEMFDRNNDWATVVSKANALIVSQKSVSRKDVIAKVEEINHALNIIAGVIEKGDVQVSAPTVTQFAKQSYAMAQQLELFSTYEYQLIGLSVALQDSADKLKSL